MLWFESIENVRAFAGESYEVPVISSKAKSLLARFADRADHYDLSGSSPLNASKRRIASRTNRSHDFP